MKRSSWMWFVVLGGALACSRKMEGPSPSISTTNNEVDLSRSPAVVCNAQGNPTTGWLVDIMGDNFSPIPENVLVDSPGTMLPTVSLSGPSSYSLPAGGVFFVDKTKLVIQMPTKDTASPQQLTPGSYRVTVTNPDGKSAQLDGAITIVPPPTITSVTVLIPPLPTSDGTIAIDGSNFEPGTTPKVVISGSGLNSVQLTNVSVINATRVTAVVPANTPEGVYDVTVANPDGCTFTLQRVLTISYNALGALALDPRFGWQLKNQGITIYNSPNGTQKTFSGGAPQGWIVAPLKTAPTIAVEIPLRRIAYVSPTVITAAVPDCSGLAATPITDPTCPNGIQPGGPYPIKIRDPGGALGVIPAAQGFWVLSDPPPIITSIAPSSIDTNGLPSSLGSALVVTGQNFGSGAELQLLSPNGSGGIRACNLSVASSSATSIQAPVPTSLPTSSCVEFDSSGNQQQATAGFTLSVGLYVVRVQNTSNAAYADFSGLIVTNPSLNPRNGSAVSTTLSVARADFPLVQASDDLGNQYLYALGGTDGTNTLSSVEVAPVTLFGDVGGDCSASPCKFRVLDRAQIGMGTMGNTPQPRRGTAAVVRTIPGETSYIYLIGGVDSTSKALKVVERAQVLKAADAPVLATVDTSAGGNLSAGTYYYRVSAILNASNPLNPAGETLASDEQPVTVNSAEGQVSLSWTCIPGVQKYRIYRTVNANGISGTELLLDEVSPAMTCTGSPLPSEIYDDAGGRTPSGDKPLPAGALGRWVSQPALSVERGNGASKLIGDHLYVAGGFCSTVSSSCSAPGVDLASVETAAFASGSHDLGSFSSSGNLQKARRRFALTLADAATAPSSFSSASPDNTHDEWLLAVGGDTGGVLSSPVIEVGQVMNASGPIGSPTFSASSYNAPAVHGGWSELVGNDLFQAGTTSTRAFSFHSNVACPGTGGQVDQCTGAASFKGTLNSTGISYLAGGTRYLGGEVLFRAYVYLAGGFPDDVTLTPTNSIERIVY